MAGIFYGVGVGPGDPELLTEKAKRILEETEILAVPVNNGMSTAHAIVRQIVKSGNRPVLELSFPMQGKREEWRVCQEQAADRIAGILKQGKRVALVTLGDVTLYSSCMYIFMLLKKRGFAAELVPGISAASAGAALAGISMAQDQESVAVIPLGREPERYRALMDGADNLILMKAGSCIPWIVDYMEQHRIPPEQAVVFSNLGLSGEFAGSLDASRSYGYFTTVIVRKNPLD